MKKIIFGLILLLSIGAQAADFTVELVPAPGSVQYSDVANKPATFAPSAHSHAITDITNLQSTLSDKASNASVALKANQSDLTSGLALKADSSSLGSLSTKNTITNSEVANGALSAAKIASFTTEVVNSISATLLDYVKKTDLKKPVIVRLTSGSNQTYTPSAGVSHIRIRMVGGGGGGGGSSSGIPYSGTAGTATTFGALTAGGGSFGSGGSASNGGTAGGAGGSATGGNILNTPGGSGGGAGFISQGGAAGYLSGGAGGTSQFRAGAQSSGGTAAGESAAMNTGAGGQGSSNNGTSYAASGGGAGGYVEHMYSTVAPSYSYTIGAGGAGATSGPGGQPGGAGGSGLILVEEYFQ